MTVKAHKKGYIGAMVLSIVSALSTLFQFIMGHAPIVGVLVPVVTILMITLIYVFYNNMRKANSELFDTIKELNASNEALKDFINKVTVWDINVTEDENGNINIDLNGNQ